MKKGFQHDRVGNRFGFTLTEMLVAAALMAVCAAIATAGFGRVIGTTVAASRSAMMHRELRNGLGVISRDIMASRQVLYGATNSNVLILRQPTPSGSVYVYYLLYQNTLFRFTSAQPGSSSLGTRFQSMNLSFYSLDGAGVSPAAADAVHVRLNGQVQIRNTTMSDAVETRVRLRNRTG